MNIFIFEDEYAIATALKQHLLTLGYQNISMAYNLDNALRAIAETDPDIAILDIMTPTDKEAGIKVARYLNARRRHIPIIFMTASDDELIIERALGTRPHGYLSKTFNERIILYSIEKAIENLVERTGVGQYAAGQTGSYGKDSFILLKKKNVFHKVCIMDILYVHAVGGAIRIFTEDAEYSFASTLTVFQQQVDADDFVKVGRNYIVNLRHFSAFLQGNHIQVHDRKILLSASEYKKLFNTFEVFRTKPALR
jgi:DNA-binding LytR/AlgR family response regulator